MHTDTKNELMQFTWQILTGTLILPADGFLYLSRNMLRIKFV